MIIPSFQTFSLFQGFIPYYGSMAVQLKSVRKTTE